MILAYFEKNPSIDSSAFLAKDANIIGDVSIGPDSSVWFGSVIRGDMAEIRIGTATNIQDQTVIHVSTGFPVFIGNFVTIGHRAILHGCTIGDGTMIGMGATIMDGVKIGKDCIIGANSLVSEGTVIPDYSVAYGTPAKLIRKISDREVSELYKRATRYVDVAKNYKMEEENERQE